MLQDIDHIEASCVMCAKVCEFDHLEQSKICVVTVNVFGIIMLSVLHDLMVRVRFMKDPGDVLGQRTAVVLSVTECALYISQTWDFSRCSPLNILVPHQTTSDRYTANRGTVGLPSNLQRSAAGFNLNGTCQLAGTHWILCCRYRYNPEDFVYLFVIISWAFPQQQMMAPHESHPGVIGSESSQLTGACSDAPPAKSKLLRRH